MYNSLSLSIVSYHMHLKMPPQDFFKYSFKTTGRMNMYETGRVRPKGRNIRSVMPCRSNDDRGKLMIRRMCGVCRVNNVSIQGRSRIFCFFFLDWIGHSVFSPSRPTTTRILSLRRKEKPSCSTWSPWAYSIYCARYIKSSDVAVASMPRAPVDKVNGCRITDYFRMGQMTARNIIGAVRKLSAMQPLWLLVLLLVRPPCRRTYYVPIAHGASLLSQKILSEGICSVPPKHRSRMMVWRPHGGKC